MAGCLIDCGLQKRTQFDQFARLVCLLRVSVAGLVGQRLAVRSWPNGTCCSAQFAAPNEAPIMPVSPHHYVPETVVIHPLVLLSVVDHYNRVARHTRRRVVGILLGQVRGKIVNVANSFAVPFEEDEKDPSVWFLDHNYVEAMNEMFKKVNAKERMIGWYHTGPKLRSSDLEVNELMKRYVPHPVLVIVTVKPNMDVGLPTDSYFAVEEIQDDGTPSSMTFMHIPSAIEAEEAEEIGVEHLLRDIKDNAVSTLSTRIAGQMSSLKGLLLRLGEISDYLSKVASHELPINHNITYILQDVFNLLPNLNIDTMAKAFRVKTNDQYLVIYLASLVRAIHALHNLINNKISNRDAEEKEEKKKKEEELRADQGASENSKESEDGGERAGDPEGGSKDEEMTDVQDMTGDAGPTTNSETKDTDTSKKS